MIKYIVDFIFKIYFMDLEEKIIFFIDTLMTRIIQIQLLIIQLIVFWKHLLVIYGLELMKAAYANLITIKNCLVLLRIIF